MRYFRFAALLLALLFSAGCLLSCGSGETRNFYAMGSYVTVTAYGGVPAECASVVAALENRISRNVSSSVISAANGGETVSPGDDVMSALRVCGELTGKTGGAFDLSVGAVSALWHFDGGEPSLPDAGELAAALACCGWSDHVSLSEGELTVSGGALDLGAIGKGMACDVLVACLREHGRSGIVSVGGSVGTLPGNGKDRFTIGIRDPFGNGAYIGKLTISEGFVSTSGTYEKFFEMDGKTYHHLLDARTGMPAETGLCSVTVVAPSGFLSDALSTAAFLLGAEEGMALCREYGAEAIFVMNDGTVAASSALRDALTFPEGLVVDYR